jgi:hypothetical protein
VPAEPPLAESLLPSVAVPALSVAESRAGAPA